MGHQGNHNHPWPQAKKPHKLAQEELKKQVALNPKAGALKSKVCALLFFLISNISLKKHACFYADGTGHLS